ncbi:Glutathione S-transferase T3, partial [Bienertia sinuspersici]
MNPAYPPNSQVYYTQTYHPYMVRPNYRPTHPAIFSRPPYFHESNLAHDNTRRNSIRDSNQFQTPHSEAAHAETTNQTKNKRLKLKWSKIKDIDLCKSWITILKDPIKGNDQTKELYWRNIAEYYNTWKKEEPEIPIDKLSNHWFKMSADVSRFNGCYIQVKDSHPSGHNDEDIINKAKILFTKRYEGRKFSYIHAGEVLHTDPKWQEFSQREGNSSKRTKISRSGAYTSSSDQDNTENEDVQVLDERSTGQKAEKLARKKGWGGGGKKTSSQMVDISGEHVRQIDFEILLKDTSKMDEGTRKNHNQICSIIKAKYGL